MVKTKTARPIRIGAHRRQRPSPRSGRGAVWTGLFLLLLVVAAAVSRDLWADLAGGLLGLGRQALPQGRVLWTAEVAAGALFCLDSSGTAYLAYEPPGGAPPAPRTRVVAVSASGSEESLADVSGSPLALGLEEVEEVPAGETDGESPPTRSLRVVLVGTGGGDLVSEELLWLEPLGSGDGAEVAHRTERAVVTSAAAHADGPSVVAGLYVPDPAGEGVPEGRVIALGPAGQELWAAKMDRRPVHRVAARPGTGFIAAATPERVTLFDSQGHLLWSKRFRSGVTDLALQSHGGPAVVSAGRLLSLDRRGNLVWRKEAETGITALSCAADRIAVAAGDGVVVYDENGLARWWVPCDGSPVEVSLSPCGRLVAVVVDSGTLLVAEAPGREGGR